ncbi:mannitol-1-phosphate 5-dehydrogenase [Gulosibacter chungangensis]|uniref:Mannitol-1-phosphate 5-dehydrogenase n=1 Tax=Gulosibacter chungangensis TaxID=979746 RepID=A0A7J5BA71_9MICO|nr:mannitol-1-phosphate 5-dehydrogenase [Gulosibacter chungangensis]KAB1641683.1 mannitol-1-phosphate 5-dehydrogenase [Gulosibacter chungangensis]
MTKSAVHFGAGNIGRGFIGLVLHESGYDVVFSDVNAALVDELNAAGTYEVHEVGAEAKTHVVDRYRAVNSAENEAEAVAAVAAADIVTCAVGVGILKFIAPVIAKGLAARSEDLPKAVVMACENAINATDQLRELVLEADPSVASRAVFANTAVDRIIPAVDAKGVDVVVEDFSEWAIERGPFAGEEPELAGAHYVDDLAPYIERKLFTVNTGHATAAYWGHLEGERSIASALANPKVRAEVDAVLAETSALLIAKYGFSREEHQAYVDRTIQRFENPELPDTPVRIGRQPIRKLGRHDRFVQPAYELAEREMSYDALIRAISAALRFRVDTDPQSQELYKLLIGCTAESVLERVFSLDQGDPLYDELVKVVLAAKNDLV